MDSPRKNILITGEPKSGKSTLLASLVSEIKDKTGFITAEIIADDKRVGFELRTHKGDNATLAHVDFKTPHAVGKYHVDLEALESIAPLVSDFGSNDLLYLDEIGQMELLSENFKALVLKFLDSPNICLATLSSVYPSEFIESIKKRSDVTVIEISPENRAVQKEKIERLLGK